MYCQTTLYQSAPISGLFTFGLGMTQFCVSIFPTPQVLTVVLLLASKLELPST